MKLIIKLILFGAMLLSVSPLWAEEFVVVKENTKFYSSASSKSVFFQGEKKRFVSAKFLEEKGKRVRIELSGAHRSCQYSTANRGFDLDVWVQKKALEKVTTQKQIFTFKDGSEVELAPGLVVRSGMVIYRSEILALRVPKKMTGRRFTESFLPKVPISEERDVMSSKKGLRFNGNHYLKRKSFHTRKVGDFYEIADPCRRVKGVLVRPKEGVLKGGGGLGLRGINGRRISKGIQVYDANGEKIGLVRSSMFLSEGFVKGAFYCGVTSLFATKKPVVVCVSNKKGPEQHIRPVRRARMKAKMVMGRIKVENGRASDVKKVLKTKSLAVRYCYERMISRTPEGSISMQLKVNSDGKVESAMVFDATIESEGVQSCVVRVMERIRFKKTSKGMTINVPFVFSVRK